MSLGIPRLGVERLAHLQSALVLLPRPAVVPLRMEQEAHPTEEDRQSGVSLRKLAFGQIRSKIRSACRTLSRAGPT
jgi:hypothetical protein